MRGEGMPGQGKDLRTSTFVHDRSDADLLKFIIAGRQPWDPENTTKVPMPPKGGQEQLTDAEGGKYATDWSANGEYLIFNAEDKDTGADLWALPMKGADRKPIPLVRTKFTEGGGTLSPDGKFLAYRSNESGRTEVYVQEFPVARSKWQISTEGGRDPFWRGDGREMYYRALDLSVMAVPVSTTTTFEVGTAKALFKARFPTVLPARALFRPTRDGQRFLVLSAPESIPPVIVVLNWPSALK